MGFLAAFVTTAIVVGIFYLVVNVLLASVVGQGIISFRVMMLTGLSSNVILVSRFFTYRNQRSAQGVMVFFFILSAYIVYRFFGEGLS